MWESSIGSCLYLSPYAGHRTQGTLQAGGTTDAGFLPKDKLCLGFCFGSVLQAHSHSLEGKEIQLLSDLPSPWHEHNADTDSHRLPPPTGLLPTFYFKNPLFSLPVSWVLVILRGLAWDRLQPPLPRGPWVATTLRSLTCSLPEPRAACPGDTFLLPLLEPQEANFWKIANTFCP